MTVMLPSCSWRVTRRESCSQATTGEGRVVLVSGEPGIGRINVLHLNIGADGTVEMPEEEAQLFLRAGWMRVDAAD